MFVLCVVNAMQVPGGVGPMTIAMLLRNTVNGARRQALAAAAASTNAAAVGDAATEPVQEVEVEVKDDVEVVKTVE